MYREDRRPPMGDHGPGRRTSAAQHPGDDRRGSRHHPDRRCGHRDTQGQTDKQVRKLQAAGRTVTAIETSSASDPQVSGGGQVEPGRWHRMGPRFALALLAEQQPAGWRCGASAGRLRAAMRAPPGASEVRFGPLEALAAFARQPTTAVVVSRPGPDGPGLADGDLRGGLNARQGSRSFRLGVGVRSARRRRGRAALLPRSSTPVIEPQGR